MLVSPLCPQRYPKLRFRSVPMALDPGFGCRFLRQLRNAPPLMSYSAPSGFIANRIHTSRLLTMLVIRAFVP